MNDQELERVVVAALDAHGPTDAERAAIWDVVTRRCTPGRRFSRRWFAVPAIATAAGCAVALLPSGTSQVRLSEASAAEVLRAAADSVALSAPGPGEQLYVRERRVIPNGPTEVAESWSAADGSGRLERNGETERFRPGGPAQGDAFEDWRGAFTAAQLEELPTDRDALLERLRSVADVGDRNLVLGRDLGVLAITVQLLDRAPLDSARRSALLDLLAAAPDWTVPGTSVTPLSVERVGGDGGNVVIRVESHLTDAERRAISSGERGWALDLEIDPAAGRLTGFREYEDGLGEPPEVTTVEAQRIVPAT